jgi:hypothetical protein
MIPPFRDYYAELRRRRLDILAKASDSPQIL